MTENGERRTGNGKLLVLRSQFSDLSSQISVLTSHFSDLSFSKLYTKN